MDYPQCIDMRQKRQGRAIAASWLAVVSATLAGPAIAESSGVAATTAWSLFGRTSEIGMVGTSEKLDDQDVGVAAAASPAHWRTVDGIVLPRVSFAFDDWLDFAQSGDASGTFDPATGTLTLDLTLEATDKGGGHATLHVALTTEQTNGVDPDDGTPVCLGDLSDPPVCSGTRRDPVTGNFRLVAITPIPANSGTFFDRELVFLQLNGRIPPTDGDGDGRQDFVDNCPSTSNPGQQDIDADGLGDVCDACTDKDKDGHGSPGDASCVRGAAADCNDTDDTVYPGAPEYCDGQDDDCDLAFDEATCLDFDVNGDGLVDGAELSWLGRAFGLCSPNPAGEWWSAIDVDPDGCVDGDDLDYLKIAWSCSPGLICP